MFLLSSPSIKLHHNWQRRCLKLKVTYWDCPSLESWCFHATNFQNFLVPGYTYCLMFPHPHWFFLTLHFCSSLSRAGASLWGLPVLPTKPLWINRISPKFFWLICSRTIDEKWWTNFLVLSSCVTKVRPWSVRHSWTRWIKCTRAFCKVWKSQKP